MQHYAPPGVRGGVTETEAEQIGWRFEREWRCPFCAGQAERVVGAEA